ncbi:hypothetical protein HZB93_04635 [Candidatus Falkowbacteria bacterium]|nr:hypothetical protein [Candidatus Falkowbacteria bacterium]
MLTKLEINSRKTKEFLRYIVKEILKQPQLWPGKIIEVMISENLAPFPEVVQVFGKEAEQEYKKLIDSNSQIPWAYGISMFDFEGREILKDENDRKFERIEMATSYIRDELHDICTLKNQPITADGSSSFIAIFEIEDLEKLNRKAKELGVADSVTDNNLSQSENTFASPSISKPHLAVERNKGYLIIGGENYKKIAISKVEARSFKLLQSLFNPKLGLAKNIDDVFEGIRIEKDRNNSALHDSYQNIETKRGIIEAARRKIYSILKADNLRGALKIHINKRNCRAEWMLN